MTDFEDVFVIGERDDYAPKVGLLVSMLMNSRHYLLSAIRDLSAAELDAQPQGANNTIAALLSHLAAAETMFQAITFHGRRFNEAEQVRWESAFRFEKGNEPKGKVLESYLQDLEEVRQKTLTELKKRDDNWLETPMTFAGRKANMHYYWFHYLQDEVRHTGQIILIRKHLLPGSDASFDPYNL